MFKYTAYKVIIFALISQISDSTKLLKTEPFAQNVQTLLDRTLNITVLNSTTLNHNIRNVHIALCIASSACLAVSEPNDDQIYFAGFGQLPGSLIHVSTMPDSPLNWTSMQVLNNETTNYALYGETFASSYDEHRPTSLAVDGNRGRLGSQGVCVEANMGANDRHPWWSVRLKEQVKTGVDILDETTIFDGCAPHCFLFDVETTRKQP